MIVLMEYLDAISHPKKLDLLYVDFKCALHEKSACSAWQDLPSSWQLISRVGERCVKWRLLLSWPMTLTSSRRPTAASTTSTALTKHMT
ncbi:hypothetical protein [Aquabacterium sp.]|uniref:hypothetical protein n=1 Tax=Aquabacterium sp. TaxID=1872578 RepID=UPI0024896258|nr:hypothetical protein [Aquabacterium sp.]MDI1349439.1 hypothetical protein [Aquabacterium sp.]